MKKVRGEQNVDRSWFLTGFLVVMALVSVIVLVVLTGPAPPLVAILHGSMLGFLLLMLPLASAVRGRRRLMLLTGIGVALLYVLMTSVPFVSVEVVPRLPTERWIAELGGQVVSEDETASQDSSRRLSHWSAESLGYWGSYQEPGRQSFSMSPRRVAFQRVGHDVAAIVLGLIGAGLVGLLIVERPGTYDSEMLPANQGRGSPETLRHLLARTNGGGRGGQAPSTRA